MNKIILILTLIGLSISFTPTYNYNYCNSIKVDSSDKETGEFVVPENEHDCNIKSAEKSLSRGECCHLSWKNQGKYYAMCAALTTKDEFKKTKKDLKEHFSDVKIECSGNTLFFSMFLFVIFALLL